MFPFENKRLDPVFEVEDNGKLLKVGGGSPSPEELIDHGADDVLLFGTQVMLEGLADDNKVRLEKIT